MNNSKIKRKLSNDKTCKVLLALGGVVLGAGIACAIVLPLTYCKYSTDKVTFDENTVLEKQKFYKQVEVEDYRTVYNPFTAAELYTKNSANEKDFILTDALFMAQHNVDMFFHRGNLYSGATTKSVGVGKEVQSEIINGVPVKYNGQIELDFNKKTQVFSLHLQEWIQSISIPDSDSGGNIVTPTDLYINYHIHNYKAGWLGEQYVSAYKNRMLDATEITMPLTLAAYVILVPSSTDPNISRVSARGRFSNAIGTTSFVSSLNVQPEYIQSAASANLLSAKLEELTVVAPTNWGGAYEETPINISNKFGYADVDDWARVMNDSNTFYLDNGADAMYDSVGLNSSTWNFSLNSFERYDISSIYISIDENIVLCHVALVPGFIFAGDINTNTYVDQQLTWPS